MRRTVAGLVAALFLVAPAAAAACPKTTLADVEDEVMCTVCGTPLVLNPDAEFANDQRKFIQARIDECKSKDEVKAALKAEFGPEVLSLPEDEGFDLAAYVVPLLAGLGGLGVVGATLVVWRRRRLSSASGGAPAEEPTPLDRDDAARLQADMDRYGV